jgi:hypothetical protein
MSTRELIASLWPDPRAKRTDEEWFTISKRLEDLDSTKVKQG